MSNVNPDAMTPVTTTYPAPTASNRPLILSIASLAAAVLGLTFAVTLLAGNNTQAAPVPVAPQVIYVLQPAPQVLAPPVAYNTADAAKLPVGCNTAQQAFINATLAWGSDQQLQYLTDDMYEAHVPGTDIDVTFTSRDCSFFYAHNYYGIEDNIDGTVGSTVQQLTYKRHAVTVARGSSCFLKKGDVPRITLGTNGAPTVITGTCDDVV